MKTARHICFVCTGNASRSPFAEAVLRQELRNSGINDITVSSIGTLNWGENPRDEVMARLAEEIGYHMDGLTTYMEDATLDNVDIIFVMSPGHRDLLTSVLPYRDWNKIHMFSELLDEERSEVPDPIGQNEFVYQQVSQLIVEGCKKLAHNINDARKAS